MAIKFNIGGDNRLLVILENSRWAVGSVYVLSTSYRFCVATVYKI